MTIVMCDASTITVL